jgi:methionyl-tRNA formyltransferase
VKILFLSNNENTKPLAEWLKNEAHENIVIFTGKIDPDKLHDIKPEFIISFNYKYVINENVIHMFRNRIINLHISLLPWNKGAHPNIWSFLENTPKGVTIHVLDEGLDTGDILVQRELYFDEQKETFLSTYNALNSELQKLFIENWDKIKKGKIIPKKQSGKGSFHLKKDLEKFEIFKANNAIWEVKISDIKKNIHAGTNNENRE